MISVKELIEGEPFKNRLRFLKISEAANVFGGQPFTVVCSEKSRVGAVRIKDAANGRAKIVEIASNFPAYKKSPLLKGENLLAIGGRELLSTLRKICKKGDNRLIALLLDFSIADAFKKTELTITKDGAAEKELCPLEEVIVDLKYLINASRALFADAFFECAAISLFKLDSLLLSVAEKSSPPSTIYENAVAELLKNCNENNLFSSLICAEIILAKFFYEGGGLISNGLFMVANALKKIEGAASYPECLYASAKALVSLYLISTERDLSNSEIMPDYVKRLQGLVDLYGGGPDDFFKDYIPLSEAVIHSALSGVASSKEAKAAALAAKLDLNKTERVSALTYSGKKKMASFSKADVCFAIKHGGYLSGGFLKYLSDAGITEAISG